MVTEICRFYSANGRHVKDFRFDDWAPFSTKKKNTRNIILQNSRLDKTTLSVACQKWEGEHPSKVERFTLTRQL